MAVFTRTTRNLIIKIDEFFHDIDIGLLVFREAVKAYINKDMESLERHVHKVELLENNADKLQRSIGNDMITYSILPQQRADVITLIDVIDEIIDTIKKSINGFYIELPDIPESLESDFINLTEVSVSTGEELIPAARAYFRTPHTVREKLLKVYYFESETDRLVKKIKKTIFQEMEELDLAQKTHLRYIIHHIENISDTAQKAADLLLAMAIKIVL